MAHTPALLTSKVHDIVRDSSLQIVVHFLNGELHWVLIIDSVVDLDMHRCISEVIIATSQFKLMVAILINSMVVAALVMNEARVHAYIGRKLVLVLP